MTATTASAVDRSDFPHVLRSGTKTGLAVAAGVVLFVIVSRLLPAGTALVALETVLVLATGLAAALLPARWAAPRTAEGVAGAAAIGLFGTVVFSVVDIVVLRTVNAYPWTWDAVGGGSTWWYLPIWWMLGTFVAWMGGLRAAGQGEAGAVRAAVPLVAGALVLAAVARLAGAPGAFPVLTGAGLVVSLAALAAFTQARSS